jgi:hypothetical protein
MLVLRAGVDGCKNGWFFFCLEGEGLPMETVYLPAAAL